MDLKQLAEPFDPARISWRVGSTTADKTRGRALAYLDSRDVQDRLDDVCGPENWSCHYKQLGPITVCEIAIKCGDEWVGKEDGAGASDFEAEKGAMSDSFKRSAVKWSIGRYLYDIEAPWIAIEAIGKSYKIKDSELPRLQALLAGKHEKATERKERETKSDAKEWAESQVPLIMEMNAAQFHAWEVKTAAAMERLKKVEPSTYEWVEAKIEIRREQLKVKAA